MTLQTCADIKSQEVAKSSASLKKTIAELTFPSELTEANILKLRLRRGDPSMNLTLNASAKWVIEASREVQNPNTLLEKFSLNRKVDDPTRALLLTFYGILVTIGAVGNALVVISKDIEEKTAIIKTLQTDNANLQATVSDLSERLSALEQNMRENNIEINGIPESKSENLVNTISQLAKTVNQPFADDDFLHVTRVAKLNRDSARPRTVVVKLRSTRHRDALLAAVATYNRKNPKNKLSSSHLGVDGPSVPVFVSEHLSPANKSLHAATRKKAKEMAYKFVWVRGGRIYVRKDEFSQAKLIRNTMSLKNIS
ncbi:unnamed protein product [Euphydryas editha]|uniref:FP protein C-terminal domain-containing protein n=1 Tax=Euphydryas editha TaxID=104508 RepID=A0AAU9UHB4_EUPED|nr:unnamed protein product [Euphydryas editha]